MIDRYSNLEVMKILAQVESDFPVETWSINEVHIWPMLRNSFCWASLQRFRTKENYSLKKVPRLFQLGRALKTFVSVFLKVSCHFLSKKNSETLFLSDGVSKMVFDQAYDKFCCPIQDFLTTKKDKRQAILFSQLEFSEPYLRKIYFSLASLNEVVYYVSRFILLFIKPEINLEKYDEFMDFLKKKKIDVYFMKTDLVNHFIQVKLLSLFFYYYIKFKGVKNCYVVCYYGILGYALSLACRKAKLELTDIQHGAITNCPSYHRWKNTPSLGYKIIPHNFLFWDELSVEIFQSENSQEFKSFHTSETFGIPCLQSQRIKLIIDRQAHEITQIRKQFKNMVLVPLQPQFYGRRDWDRLAKEISKCSQNWLWWIRPHPCYKDNEGLEAILNLKGENIYSDEGNYSIYSILMNSGAVITTASSTIIEASIFNVPSFIISPTGLEDFEHYIKKDKAYYINEETSIVEYVKSFIRP
jgi:hypothetical protein